MTPRLTEQDVAPLWGEFASPTGITGISTTVPNNPLVRFANAVLAKFGGVSETEAREKERAAFALGGQWFYEMAKPCEPAEGTVTKFFAKRDEVLPSLPPPRKTVTLSTGAVYWRSLGRWQGDVPCPDIASGKLCAFGPPICVTAEDFDKCAALLREEEHR